eukprot:10954341-Heterocapsa_arctica.AAC.1
MSSSTESTTGFHVVGSRAMGGPSSGSSASTTSLRVLSCRSGGDSCCCFGACAATFMTTGRRMVNVVPTSISDSTVMRPPWSCTTSLAIGRPRPMPW